MTFRDAIPDALGIVEDAILGALAGLPAAWPPKWGALDPAVAASLRQPSTVAGQWAYVAQHQDQGGGVVPVLGAQPWTGLVLVKVFARMPDDARAGLAPVDGAMASLAAPVGYAIHARYLRPQTLPRELIAGAGSLYRITVGRAA